MTVEEIPSDKVVKMTAFWHKAFKIAGCDPMCHCCRRMIKTGQYFKLATVFKATGACLHWYKDMSEIQIKALKGEEIGESDLAQLKDDFYFEEKFKEKGGLKGIIKLAQPENKEVMLCSKCRPKDFFDKEIKRLEAGIIERDKIRGGCFRINGKIVH